MIDIAGAAAPATACTRFDFWIADRGDRRRAVGRRPRGRRDRRRALARLARSTSPRGPPMPLLGREPEHAGLPRSRARTPTTRRTRASPCCGSTAGCSSPPPTRSRPHPRASSTGEGRPRGLVLDLEGVNFVDSQGSAKLAEIRDSCEADGVTFRLARVKPAGARRARGRRRPRPDRPRSHARQRPPRGRG